MALRALPPSAGGLSPGNFIELAAVKYAAKENGGTYDKFFGGIGSFKKNWLKQARRKLLK